MHGLCTFHMDDTDKVSTRIIAGKPHLQVGDFVLMLTEPQLREIVEQGIDLLSDLHLAAGEEAA